MDTANFGTSAVKDYLADLTFRDEESPIPVSQVAKRVVSQFARTKAGTKVNADGTEAMSFRSLIQEAYTLTYTTFPVRGADICFNKTSAPTPTQRRAFELIEIKIPT